MGATIGCLFSASLFPSPGLQVVAVKGKGSILEQLTPLAQVNPLKTIMLPWLPLPGRQAGNEATRAIHFSPLQCNQGAAEQLQQEMDRSLSVLPAQNRAAPGAAVEAAGEMVPSIASPIAELHDTAQEHIHSIKYTFFLSMWSLRATCLTPSLYLKLDRMIWVFWGKQNRVHGAQIAV